VKHTESPERKHVIKDEAFWNQLKPGDALLMPGHVVLVDYPITGELGTSAACVWEASGHHQIKKDGQLVYMEELAHHGTIDETWLSKKKIATMI